jgi:DNA-binding transcriptional MerR regulator
VTASAVLELTELAVRADVPADRLRHYAEVGLLPPASRDGDRFGYPAGEVEFVRLLTDVEQLGVTAGDLADIATAWHAGNCAGTQRQLIATLTARLAAVQADLAAYGQQAADLGPGTSGWADATRASVTGYEHAARLQTVIAALASTPRTGPCGDGCGCRAALIAPGIAYQFPAIDDGKALACDLAADGGDVHDRIGVWQQVLARVQRRDPVPDTDAGVALRFPLDADLAATLARLVAAEYRCCAFGSYTIVIDHTGLRLEVRMPNEAAGQLAAVFGLPDSPARAAKEASGAAYQA